MAMDDTVFQEILMELALIHKLSYGHLRFGQMIGNVLPERLQGDVYYVLDQELLDALRATRRMMQGQKERV